MAAVGAWLEDQPVVHFAAAAPGEKVPLKITIKPQAGWHAYELALLPPDESAVGNKPTLVVVKAPTGYKVESTSAGSPAASSSPVGMAP